MNKNLTLSDFTQRTEETNAKIYEASKRIACYTVKYLLSLSPKPLYFNLLNGFNDLENSNTESLDVVHSVAVAMIEAATDADDIKDVTSKGFKAAKNCIYSINPQIYKKYNTELYNNLILINKLWNGEELKISDKKYNSLIALIKTGIERKTESGVSFEKINTENIESLIEQEKLQNCKIEAGDRSFQADDYTLNTLQGYKNDIDEFIDEESGKSLMQEFKKLLTEKEYLHFCEYIADKSYKDIAEKMDSNVKTVSGYISRIRIKGKKWLASCDSRRSVLDYSNDIKNATPTAEKISGYKFKKPANSLTDNDYKYIKHLYNMDILNSNREDTEDSDNNMYNEFLELFEEKQKAEIMSKYKLINRLKKA